MNKSLGDWLKEIGQELGEETLQSDGSISKITLDEQLARMIWKRALGYEEEVELHDGSPGYRNHPPDAKAQIFIVERREGKQSDRGGKDSPAASDRLDDAIKNQLNATTEKLVHGTDIDN